ncbi:peroxide stress protein YaaA [uncultured Capnocytophaga sp.]|uniref:peroxide stress protein YaaA n=1 Tax=uncultured Capnocytophaga sp. TaxID=159273 RepID=UPI000F296CAE|nr:peroxide stress protein YaaA [uncultured Capnocytophaga sp.]RKW10321.1 MAG: peroxide stress protein YaaA [Capnocytophaga sp.]
MKIIISPSKNLNFFSTLPTKEYTQPIFQKEIAQVHKELKELSLRQIAQYMGISMNLAQLNWERYQDFSLPLTPENARPALFAYAGTVYEGLDAYSLSLEEIQRLQKDLRIPSGFYGLLKPLDLIAPYRLEMGTKITIDKAIDLYDFWSKKVTEALNKELQPEELLINLASVEYAKVINRSSLKATIITPIFKQWKGDTLRTIISYTKKARGSMVRYIAQNNLTEAEDLKGFNLDGYSFNEELSSDKELVFVR